MRDAIGMIWNALHSASAPVVAVMYGDLGLLESAVEEVCSLANPQWKVMRVSDVAQALSAPPDALVLLVPADEVSVLLELEGGRERFLDREVPVVVFLRRGGEGERALRETISLTSWLRGSLVDPESVDELDVAAAREEFERETGRSPEAWLTQQRSGQIDRSAGSLARTYAALLLERVNDVG